MDDVASAKLSDVVLGLQRGKSYKSSLFGQAGPILLGLGTIQRNGGFRGDDLRAYGGDSPENILLTPGDLYVSLKDMTHAADLLGAVARVPECVPLGRLTQDTIRLDVDDEMIDRNYLYWALRDPACRRYCRKFGTGTTNLDLSRVDFLAYPIRMPPRVEQWAIAEVLGALDDKIAANTRLVEACDELASALFARMSAVPEQRPLSELADFVNGKAFTKGASGTGRVVIRIAELNSGIGGSTVRSDIEVPDQYVARPGDLLFAWSGSLTVHRWFRPEGIVNQHIFKVIPRGDYPLWLVNQVLHRKLKEFRLIAADKATTMGHIQRRHLDEAVPVPGREAIAANDEPMTALWDRALAAEQESLRLIETRDALLPLLMSGKARVKDAEKIAEEAL